MNLLITLLTAGANILLGLLVYIKNPKSATNKLFGLLTFVIVAWTGINYYSVQTLDPQTTLSLVRIIMAIAVTMFGLLYLLASSFPNLRLNLSKNKLVIFIVDLLAIQFVSLSPLVFSSVKRSPSGDITPVPGILMPLYAGHIFAYLIFTIHTLINKRKALSGTGRSQVNLMILGISLTFILAIVSNFLFVVIFQFTDFVIFGPTYTLILVGSIAYSISKHKFLDISYLVFRAVSFTLVSLAIIAIYALLLFKFLQFSPENYRDGLSILLALILAYSYGPIKRVIESITKNIFHREPYSSEILLEDLGNILRSTIDINKLTKLISDKLVKALNVQYVAFVVVNDSNQHTTYTVGKSPKLHFSETDVHNFITVSNYKTILFDELVESSEKMLLRSMDIGAVLPLTTKSTHHGLVLLGQKTSGDAFTNQDIEVFNLLLPQLAIAIQNAKSFDEISKFNIKLKEEVERQTKDLKDANEHLKHLDQLKDEFVFIATHELKNPVTAMRGYLSLLNEGLFGDIPDKMRDPVQQLTDSNQQLVELVNDLLQIARSEAKTLKLQTEPVELKNVVDSVVEAMKPLATEKQLEITHEAPLPMVVNADPQRLREVLQNLVSNAIKYSLKGTVKITHEVKPDSIITHVSDTGVGISDADQEKLFTRFFRADAVVSEGIPGTGLGLFIVKQLIEKMGGKIWVNSQLNQGSTFSFSLPRLG